jgi:hypothetical protein
MKGGSGQPPYNPSMSEAMTEGLQVQVFSDFV